MGFVFLVVVFVVDVISVYAGMMMSARAEGPRGSQWVSQWVPWPVAGNADTTQVCSHIIQPGTIVRHVLVNNLKKKLNRFESFSPKKIIKMQEEN